MKNLKMMAVAAIALSFASCSDDDKPQQVIENEVITTVTATLTPTGGGAAVVLKSQDLDGDGPNPPVVTVSGPLAVNTSYTGAVTFLNETVSPAENITEEIHELGVEHQIFFRQSGLGTFTYSDTDEAGKPIGLSFGYTTANVAASGNLTVTLRHLPNKSATGVAGGDITNAGGSTDAEVIFPIVVQ
ncbi:MAG: type 1 periplasmic binding fold superfamily protein [Bacteroidia bacterium]